MAGNVKLFQRIGFNKKPIFYPDVIDVYAMVGCFYVPITEDKALRFDPTEQLEEDQEEDFVKFDSERWYFCEEVFTSVSNLKKNGRVVGTLIKVEKSITEPNGLGFKALTPLQGSLRKLKLCFPQPKPEAN